MKTLTPSVKEPTVPQAEKLSDRIYVAARKSGIDSGQFQDALAYPGTELEDGMVVLLVRFAKKARGIITPVGAEDSGLIPNGWTIRIKNGVRQDFPEGDVDLAKLDYSICPVREGESYVNGDTMLERAVEAKAYGSLGFAAILLKEQEKGKEIFPVESRGKHYFIMPLTELLLDVRRLRRVACFDWCGRQWVLRFGWLDSGFDGSARFVRPRE